MSTIETRQLRGTASNHVRRAGASILVAIPFAACAPTTPTVSSSPSPSPLVLGRENCNQPSPRVPSPGMEPPALVGTVTEGHSIRALMEPLVYVGDEAKIIWRMTGTGSLVIYAVHDDGTRIEPLQMDPHAGVGDGARKHPGPLHARGVDPRPRRGLGRAGEMRREPDRCPSTGHACVLVKG